MTEVELPSFAQLTEPPADGSDASAVPVAVLESIASHRVKIGLDAALPAHSRLGVGYGNSGTNPMRFSIPEGQNQDVGFFRLFLSTTPTSFQSIAQLSPFEGRRGAQPPRAEGVVTERWSAKTATVIQIPRCG